MKKQTDHTPWCRDHKGTVYTFEEYFDFMKDFHGYPAPGLIIGGRMVDIALERFPKGTLFDAISETSYCLPDAIQMLTLCTTGNAWLNVVDLGRFALTLYDKHDGTGIRVFLDPGKMKPWQEIMNWFYKLKPKPEQDNQLLREQIKAAGSDIFSVREVQVAPRYLEKRSKGKTTDCPQCGEAFPSNHGTICRGCQGDAPYS
ncbi:MAG: formylmethanofuran dehydrogenase subunit E family protein [Desulfobacterium sp.]|nr:formylmethanofuran dehydrogenase subunit E family protein [Desulfobacterium sp.]